MFPVTRIICSMGNNLGYGLRVIYVIYSVTARAFHTFNLNQFESYMNEKPCKRDNKTKWLIIILIIMIIIIIIFLGSMSNFNEVILESLHGLETIDYHIVDQKLCFMICLSCLTFLYP